MKTYLVNYQSFNSQDYAELVSARNKTEARKMAKKAVYRKDDRDYLIISVEERNDLNK